MAEKFLRVAERMTPEDAEKEELQQERERLLHELQLTPLTVFDSNKKTEGRKEVMACKNANGTKVILRIGERRPEWFFTEGYIGKTLRIPRQISAGGKRIPYEVEEWIEGKMICESESEWSRRGQLSPAMQEHLLKVFWEFQKMSAKLPLEHLFTMSRVEEFAHEAKELLPDGTEDIISNHKAFWNAAYPSKWKFATDNLIVDENGKVTLIDNVKVGARYFGYDLGWLIWPRWVEMDEEYMDAAKNMVYLDEFKKRFVTTVPSDVAVPNDVTQAFTLMLFERLVGSLYDVKRQVRHFADWGMAGDAGAKRREAHKKFLQTVLAQIIERLS